MALGCYSYAPVELEQVTPGAQARARVSPQEAARLSESLGRQDRLIEGQVIETGSDRLLLAVPMTTGSVGLAPRQFHQRIELTRSGMLELEERKFSPLKTGLVIGAAAILAGAATAAAFAALDAGDGDSKPNPDRIVVPLFRF
jgi:hypothetical protein